jgi:hypothetical protein
VRRPLVSVLTTVYNRETYLATAIESVLAQSMEDFELLIVDDGSTDRSVEIARRYERDPRLKVYVNGKNLGDYPNRNRAASLATGKYLKYVDSDDAIYPHCLEVMTHMMERHPQAGFLLCAWSTQDPYYPFELSPLEAYRRCFVHGERMSNSPLTTMYRRSAFESLGRYDAVNWPLSADWDMVLRIARDYAVVLAPTGLAFYRVHGGQVVSTQTTITKNFTTEGMSISLKALRHPHCPLPVNEKQWALGRLLRGVVIYTGVLVAKRGQIQAALHFLKHLAIRPKEWGCMFEVCRPMVLRPLLPAELDWADYPRSKPDRLKGPATLTRSGVGGVSLIIAGYGNAVTWERTIRSAIVQSENCLEIVMVCEPPDLSYMANLSLRYPFVRILNAQSSCLWKARNEAARQVVGNVINFVEPGVLLYPYHAEFGSKPFEHPGSADLAAWGQLGSVPFMSQLDSETAVSLDLINGYQVLRVPLSSMFIRRSVFLENGGFDARWGAWSAYELFFRMALQKGVVHGMLGINDLQPRDCPGSAEDIPRDLVQHLEALLQTRFGSLPRGHLWFQELREKAPDLRANTFSCHHWDWAKYPWARTNSYKKIA